MGLAIGERLGTGAHRLLARPRRLAVTHVGVAFPELDPGARERLVAETFRAAGQSFAELALFGKILRAPDYVRLEGAEALDRALAAGRGAIAVTGHVGNWELLAAWAAAIGYPITVVVRRVTDLRFHSLIVRFRAAAGVEILVRDDPRFIAGVTEALQRNRVVAMLIDQDTRGAGVFVHLFALRLHLRLRGLDLFLQVLQLGLLGLELLVERLELALAFVGADHDGLNVDDADLGRAADAGRSRRRSAAVPRSGSGGTSAGVGNRMRASPCPRRESLRLYTLGPAC